MGGECTCRIGAGAFVGAGAVVNKDIKPYALVVGVPAKHIGWMSEYGEKIPLPLTGKGSYTCPYTGVVYCLNDTELSKLDF